MQKIAWNKGWLWIEIRNCLDAVVKKASSKVNVLSRVESFMSLAKKRFNKLFLHVDSSQLVGCFIAAQWDFYA